MTVTKDEAEVRKLLAEAAKAEAEAQAYAEEAAYKGALALKHQREADMVAIQLGHEKRDEERTLAEDWYKHVYNFEGVVDRNSVRSAIRFLRQYDRLEPECGLKIIFNRPGGSVIDGMALFDEIVTMSKRGGGSHHITTVVRGYAASMAGILLQAGDHRVSGAESYLMIHEIAAGTGGKIGEIKDDVKFYDRICDRVVDIFVERSGGKISKAGFKKRWERQDWWLDSAEALKLGFIDQIG